MFTDMLRRGRKKPWDIALSSNKIQIRDHRIIENDPAPLVPKDMPLETKIPHSDEEVMRHRTAIARNGLSSSMNLLLSSGLLGSEVTVLDYGCGQDDDVRALRNAGFEASGWDPHFASDSAAMKPNDIVNLGFVLNVIEDIEERRDVLKTAFSLTNHCLAVAVMLVGKGNVSGLRPHRDGYLTSRNTFQKYYMQAEIREFIEDVLGVDSIAAAGGLFLVFKDETLEQRYLLRRQLGFVSARLEPSLTRRPARSVQSQSRQSVADTAIAAELASVIRTLGRTPVGDEIPGTLFQKMRKARVSLGRGLSFALETITPEEIEQAAASRKEALAMFFALQAFSKRQSYRALSPDVQRDVKAFFGSAQRAAEAGRTLLFSIGNTEDLLSEANASVATGIGHVEQDKFQFHARDLGRLSARLRTYVAVAERLAGDLSPTTIFRIHPRKSKLTALSFDDFATAPLPRLTGITIVNLRSGSVDILDPTKRRGDSVLFMKSRFMKSSDDGYDRQRILDQKLAEIDGEGQFRSGRDLIDILKGAVL